jgi:hypothetical protein
MARRKEKVKRGSPSTSLTIARCRILLFTGGNVARCWLREIFMMGVNLRDEARLDRVWKKGIIFHDTSDKTEKNISKDYFSTRKRCFWRITTG